MSETVDVPPPVLTGQEQESLKKFREVLGDTTTNDLTLIRFLRARQLNIEKAQAMWQASEKWRAEFGVDELYKTFQYPEKAQVQELYATYYHKTDKVTQRRIIIDKETLIIRLKQIIIFIYIFHLIM